MATNLFQELKDLLSDFKTFLEGVASTVGPVIKDLSALLPQIKDLLGQLIGLMQKLKTEINDLDLSGFGLDKLEQVSEFTTKTTNLLTSIKGILPNQAATIDQVLEVAAVASSLPSFGDLKNEITGLIDDIIGLLQGMQ